MDGAPGLLAVAALILANGYFVAAEFAYVAARRPALTDRAQGGQRGARRALEVLRRLSFMLSGAQLGITVTSLLVGFIAEDALASVLRGPLEAAGIPSEASLGVALTLGLLLATGAQMVFGELAPKNLAIARPESFAVALAPTTLAYLRIAKPVIRLFDSSANRLLRAVGIEPVEELQTGVSAEELGLIIDESGREGTLTPTQAALLRRSLEFRQLRAADAMVSRTQIVSLAVTATCDELRQRSVETGHSRFLIVGDGLDDVRGVVQAKALLRLPVDARSRTPVSRLMSRPLAVPESAPLPTLLAELREAHTPLAVVVDEYGGTAGIVTLEDIVEELVGEIRDEYDPTEPAVHRLLDGSFLLPGSWRLDEVARDIGVPLPEGDYDTLSGLLMAHLDRLPEVGDEVTTPHAHLRVTALDGRAVGEIRLTLLDQDGDEAP